MTNAPEHPGTTMMAPTPQHDGPAGAPPQGPSAASHPPGGLRVRDRVWSMRTVVAAAITAVALAGAGGAALAAASNGSGSQGFGPGGQMGRGGFPGQVQRFQQGQAPGQLPGQTNGSTGQMPGGPPPAAGVPGQLPPATSTSGGRDT